MRITKSKIRSLSSYLLSIRDGKEFFVGIPIDNSDHEMVKSLIQIGFDKDLSEGDVVLPTPIGRVTNYNANGKVVVRKDLPKETKSYPVWWTWKDWQGNEYEEVRYRDVKRYPREHLSPPSLEVEIRKNEDNELIACIGPFVKGANEVLTLHAINLFLEVFGFCEVLTDELQTLSVKNTKKLNWDIFPAGKYPWATVKGRLQEVVNNAKVGNRPVINDRFETIEKFEPDFVACGRAGFSDYVVFGFSSLGIFVLESNQLGNATYVFGDDWERLSQLTKSEVINGNLSQDRLVHIHGWHTRISKLLKPNKKKTV